MEASRTRPATRPSRREREIEFRKRLVAKALEAVSTEVKGPTVFDVSHGVEEGMP